MTNDPLRQADSAPRLGRRRALVLAVTAHLLIVVLVVSLMQSVLARGGPSIQVGTWSVAAGLCWMFATVAARQRSNRELWMRAAATASLVGAGALTIATSFALPGDRATLIAAIGAGVLVLAAALGIASAWRFRRP